MNDGLVPERGDMKTLSVLLDMSELPLSHVTSTEMSLSTAVLMEIPQITGRFVPAYKVPSGMVTLILGTGTAGSNHINIHNSSAIY